MVGTETQSEMSGRQSSTTTGGDIDHAVMYHLSCFTRPRHFILSFLYDWATSNDVQLSDISFTVKVRISIQVCQFSKLDQP